MRTVYACALDAMVTAQNNVNKAALERWPQMLDALRPFVGSKVINADGTISKKVRAALPELPHDVALSGHYSSTDYSLSARLKTCECHAGRGCELANYAERNLHLGEISRGILTKLGDVQPLRTNYSAPDVEQLRQQLKGAKARVSELESQLWPFGEYDR